MIMADKRFLLRSACYLLLINRDKILLLRRFNTRWEDGKYTLISGHLEGKETVEQAMIREAKEEPGLSLTEKDLEVVHVMHRKSNNGLEYIDFFLVSKKWKGEPRISEPDKCDDMQWFSLENLPGNTLPHIKQAIKNCFGKVLFSEFGFG